MSSAIAAAGGICIVAIALTDVFQSVIVPRAANTWLRVSRYMVRGLWRIWPRLAYLLYRRDDGKREDFLGTFAPFQLVALLISWVGMLVVGWGLFFYGIRDQLHPANISLVDSLYFAGSSLLTIGYGDIVGVTTAARLLAIVCAATGLGTVAIVISFLFAVFGSFQRRETFIVTIGARAGVPPSGVGLLTVHGMAGIRSDLAQVFREGQTWTAEVMESHLAYPILIYFRSSHDYESWVGTLGTLMDASSLVISTLDPDRMENAQTQGQARILYAIGRHLTWDFSSYFAVRDVAPSVGVEESEFHVACDQLAAAGYAVRDRDEAWNDFKQLRSAYAPHLNGMARWLEIPPVQWVGDRSILKSSPH